MTISYKDFFLSAKQNSTIVATIVPQTVNSDGTLTAGTSGSLKGQFKSFKITSRPTKDNVSSTDSPLANNLILEENLLCEFVEMQRTSVPGSGTGNVLPVMNATSDLFKVTLGYAHKTYGPFYVTRNEFSDGISGKGNGEISASFDLVDVGNTAVLPFTDA